MTLSSNASRIVLAAFFIILVGCKSRKQDDSSAAEVAKLREVDSMLRMPTPRMTAEGPDLSAFQNDFPLGYQAVKSGDVIVTWGVKMAGEGEKSSNEAIVAYEKKTPTEGGYVLSVNGNIKKMSPQEFQAAPKANK
jgi:hypothetical protein